MLPPTPSMAAAICSAFRVGVPLVSSSATNAATPSLPGGSYALPARKFRLSDSVGCSWFSTRSSVIPFGSAISRNGGDRTGRSRAGGGGGGGEGRWGGWGVVRLGGV